MDQDPQAAQLDDVENASEEGSPPVAAQQAPANNAIVAVTNVTAEGSGCGIGTWSAVQGIDRATGEAYYNVHFLGYKLDANRSMPQVQSKACRLTFQLNVAPGYKAGIAKALVNVSAELGVGMTSTVVTGIGFAGQGEIQIPWTAFGPIPVGAGNFQLPIDRLYPALTAPCFPSTQVVVNTQSILNNPLGASGSLNITDVSANVGLKITFGTMRCAGG